MARPLVIIPTYNERQNIEAMIRELRQLPVGCEVLIVDDGSPDGTGRIVTEIAARDAGVHLLSRAEKNGLGRAYCAGFAWAIERGYELIVQMDADFSHDPADVPKLIAACGTADVAIGSRYVSGIRVINWPLRRLLLSKGAAFYVGAITGLPVTDPTGGFKCFRREVLASLDLTAIRSAGYCFQVETSFHAWRKGYKIVEVPIIFTERREGASKMGGGIIVEAVWRVWWLKVRSWLP